jgi:tol-pal system protein YbgF
VVLVAAAIATAGCATRADLEQLKRDQRQVRAQVADLQVAVDTVNRQLDAMRSSIDEGGPGRDGAALRTIERRLAALEVRAAAAPAEGLVPIETPPVPGGGLPNVPRTEAAALALRREEQAPANSDTYRRALQAYRDGQADQAVQQFREFLRANPKSDQADSAQYWIGEAYYSRGDYNRAIIELNEVLLKYPQGTQVPGALLALATSFANSGDTIDAKLILQKLISDHPKSDEAQIGRQQLQTLGD